MTVASPTGVSPRPDGILRDVVGLRMLAQVSMGCQGRTSRYLLCRTCSIRDSMEMLLFAHTQRSGRPGAATTLVVCFTVV